jgi:hypothetical protein
MTYELAPLATFLVKTTKTTPEKIKTDLDAYFGNDVIDISTTKEYHLGVLKLYSVDINYTTPKLMEFLDNNPGVWDYQEVAGYSISINTIWKDDCDEDFKTRYIPDIHS